jgi:uncharacterized protein
MRIVVPGGTGHVGQVVARHFSAQGHDVCLISRGNAKSQWRVAQWSALAREIDGAQVVLNLAGRSVNCRYNEANRSEILDSRVETTRQIAAAIAQAGSPPRLWLNSSTATIYRHALDRPMDEDTGELGGKEPNVPDTWRFSIDVAKRWEQAFFERDLPATRRIALRSAMIMSPDRGSVFDVLLGLVRKGLGGTSGPGSQFVSWIHEEDFVRALDFLIAREDLDGVVNVSSPHPLPNRDFMRALRQAWGAPVGLPATAWMLEIGAVFLRTETELVLKSRRVVPGRLLAEGFEFRFPEWPQAARDLVARWRHASS